MPTKDKDAILLALYRRLYGKIEKKTKHITALDDLGSAADIAEAKKLLANKARLQQLDNDVLYALDKHVSGRPQLGEEQLRCKVALLKEKIKKLGGTIDD